VDRVKHSGANRTEGGDDPRRASGGPDDAACMDRALELARRGWGRVHPNPMVGCVLIRDGEVVGEGWHEEWGGPHAEVRALEAAGSRARGATAFVSLEPCRHHGKTPPCTQALLEAGVARLVYGAADPGEASGGGARELRERGMDVRGPLLEPREARRENPAFFHQDETRPWTVLKLAMALDGGIARAPGERTRISGDAVEDRVHHLRAGFDGILVGATTARVDDPLLTVRGAAQPRIPPARIVADGRGTLSPKARLLREGAGPVLILCTETASTPWRRSVEAAGARVLEVPGREGRLRLSAAMTRLRKEGIRALLCEGGGVLGGALLSRGLVDRIHVALAPRFLGSGAVPAFPLAEGGGSVPGEWHPAHPPELLGRDVWLTLDREEPCSQG
jgi:diaminohydroxyphosphoribosylaminopyrimidine deaminase / 5-amino-6-(5-phosphoribosylamino)uracil reductase